MGIYKLAVSRTVLRGGGGGVVVESCPSHVRTTRDYSRELALAAIQRSAQSEEVLRLPRALGPEGIHQLGRFNVETQHQRQQL